MSEEILNRVQQSELIEINLEDFFPKEEIKEIDLKYNLFQQQILKEKDFREFIKNNNWELYSNKHIALFCSADAIVPYWAYMLVASALQPYALSVTYGTKAIALQSIIQKKLTTINLEQFKGAKVVIKGCGKLPVPVASYTDAVMLLKPVVGSIMYGEPCSTVPVYKAK